MAHAAREAGVPVVTGDTKVVERGKGDGVFITTTGVGILPDSVQLGGERALQQFALQWRPDTVAL